MNYFSSNIKYLRKVKRLTQDSFSEQLGIKRSRLGSYEESRADPPITLIQEIAKLFDISIDVLINTDLEKLEDKAIVKLGNRRLLFPITVDMNNEDLIEIVPQKAAAGYLNGYADPEYIEQLDKIKLPFMKNGTFRAFPVKGDSMLPVRDGSYIIGKYLETLSDIKNGKTHIVVTKDDGIVYKRVYNKLKEDGLIHLHSDNKMYEPFAISPEEVIETWEFACHLTTEEYEITQQDDMKVMDVVMNMQAELEKLKKKIGD